MPKVKLVLPSGISKIVQYPSGTSYQAVMNAVDELAGKGNFGVKVKNPDGSVETIEADLIDEVAIEDGEVITFSPQVVGGWRHDFWNDRQQGLRATIG